MGMVASQAALLPPPPKHPPSQPHQVIKRFIMHSKKTAFIVEHDFIMATYLADRVIVYEGQPSRCATARTPQSLLTGMNAFLKNLDITFRRDPTNYRPRINKHSSTKDREQKEAGTYYYIGERGAAAGAGCQGGWVKLGTGVLLLACWACVVPGVMRHAGRHAASAALDLTCLVSVCWCVCLCVQATTECL